MPRVIETSTTIAAAKSRVWAILMDFPRYPEWNPFIPSIKGRAQVGETLEVVIAPPGRGAQTFRPRVVAVEPERRFAWLGALPIPGLFSGEHGFDLDDAAGGMRFAQSERFSGLLVPLFSAILRDTERGFESMNDALKTRAELG